MQDITFIIHTFKRPNCLNNLMEGGTYKLGDYKLMKQEYDLRKDR